MTVKTKICGLTSKEDAVWALNYGADFLGLNFYSKSPRHLSVASAAWAKELPPFASLIGIFVDASQEDILETIKKVPLKGIQLHGHESPDQIRALRFAIESLSKKIFIIKAVSLENEESLESLKTYVDVVDYLMLDTYVADQVGGTGKVFNWDWAIKAKELNKPIFLAGGLTPENVKEAVKKVQPYAVDVASGVEKSPRKKDTDKIKKFIAEAH